MKWLDVLMNKYRIVRVGMIASSGWLIWAVTDWAFNFAATSARSGMEVAAIIAAVAAPATAYGGWVFSAYAASRSGE